MNYVLADFSEKLKTYNDPESVANAFIGFATSQGACTVTTFFGTETQQQFVSTVPLWFMEQAHKEGTAYKHHVVQAVRSGVPRTLWGVDLCPSNPKATKEGIKRAHDCFDHFNQRNGISFAMPDKDGTYSGAGMGLGFEDKGETFLQLMNERVSDFAVAAFLAYSRMELFYKPDRLRSPLSNRQRQILQLLSEGYRTDMIAAKLGITNSAVNLYLAKLKIKLNVKTREQALAQALTNGWI